jgi:hypothetical protein
MTTVDSWGYPDDAGEWSGLAGYLQRSEVDIGITGMFVTQQRLSFVRYIAPTSVTKLVFCEQVVKEGTEENHGILAGTATPRDSLRK